MTAEPESPKTGTAIIFLPDVIGHEVYNASSSVYILANLSTKFINVQLVADQFASNGYFTIIPDLFHGDPVALNRPEGFVLAHWLQGSAGGGSGEGHMVNRVEPVVKAAIKYLREEKGVKKVGAVGYCFGGKYVVRGLAEGSGVDVGFAAHPSFVDEEELQKIKGPLSIAAAGKFPDREKV